MITWALVLHLSTGQFLTVLPVSGALLDDCVEAAAAAVDIPGVDSASCVEAVNQH